MVAYWHGYLTMGWQKMQNKIRLVSGKCSEEPLFDVASKLTVQNIIVFVLLIRVTTGRI